MTKQECGSAHDEVLIYHCAPSIIWTRELDHTRLIDSQRGASWTIQGVEATVWDLLLLAYPYQRVIAFLSSLLVVPAEEAKEVLLAILEKWQGEGIVETSGETRDGESGDQHCL